ncbi:MAG TPA: hypothetical protein VGB55_06455 [Tepidisphaeraceae bacterium]
MRVENPSLHESAIQHAKAEDAVWGAWREFSKNRTDENRTALRAKVAKLVQDTLRERQQRIGNLEKILRKEQADLENDRENQEQLIDEHMERLESEGPPREGPGMRGERRSPGEGRRRGPGGEGPPPPPPPE